MRDIFLSQKRRKAAERGGILKPYKYLSLQERQQFEQEYSAGARLADIAESLGIHVGTAYAERDRGVVLDEYGDPVLDENGRRAYSAKVAQQRVQEGLSRKGKRHTASIQQ